eukprot:2590198-Ditylum_brightwellii.AAC.1
MAPPRRHCLNHQTVPLLQTNWRQMGPPSLSYLSPSPACWQRYGAPPGQRAHRRHQDDQPLAQ